MGEDVISNQNDRRNRNVTRVRDAIIENIYRDRNAGYVTISYGVKGKFDMIHINMVTLVVDRNTTIQNQSGRELQFRDLEEGMTVDADFSNAMTASIPPKARAYRIVVRRDNAVNMANTKIGRILSVDADNGLLVVGNPNDVTSIVRFTITDSTLLLNRRGNRICICEFRVGQMVRVDHAAFMTFSIPPQTTAFRVQIL